MTIAPQSQAISRALPSLHTAFIHWMARDARALAQANGYGGEGFADQRNAIEHAYVSADMTYRHGSPVANIFGDLKELSSDDPWDSARDQWNNEIGRQIGEWAADHGYSRDSIGDLIIDAMQNGDLVTDTEDSRIRSQPPQSPTWNGPTWWDPSDPPLPRDFFGLPDFGDLGDWLGDLFKDFADSLGDFFRDPTGWLGDLFGFSFARHDPLIFDLDGHGVQLTSLSGSDVQFDLGADGFAERTGWVSAGDGLLVRDLNGNGLIDNGTELFGNAEQDGFAVLAQFDLNEDDVIDASDAIFTDLRIWQDANSDGLTQGGELATLADRGIVSISLETIAGGSARAGNSILFGGSYRLADGSDREVVAVAFATDQINTDYQFPEEFAFDPDALALPNLRGYGSVPDLWVAMSLDPVLKQMVEDLVAEAASFTSLHDVVGQYEIHQVLGTGGWSYPYFDYDMQAFDHMLARWAGVDTEDDERIQAENIAESFMNRQADHATNNPHFYQSFEEFATRLAVRFYAQATGLDPVRALIDLAQALEAAVPANGTELSVEETNALVAPIQAWLESRPPLDPDLQPYSLLGFDVTRDRIVGDVAGFIDTLLAEYEFDPEDPWENYTEWFEARKYILGAVDPDGAVLDERHRAYTDNLELDIMSIVHYDVDGTSGNDTLDGYDLSTKADLLTGGAGDDLLRGGAGNDAYVFAEGCGNDVVTDASGTDEIAFRGALTSDLARYSFANGNRQDLLITFEGRAESVTIIGYFVSGGRPSVESITFPDGPRASNDFIRNYVLSTLATEGDDVIAGYDLDETLSGLGGDDWIDGDKGHDTLSGGAGNDTVRGGLGDDTFLFNLGDGQDVFTDSMGPGNRGGVDWVRFGAGISAGDVVLAQADGGLDLVLSIAGTTDQITLDDISGDSANRIDEFHFADGAVLTYAQLLAMVTTPTEDDDLFYGSFGGNTLSGAGGNDMLIGLLGDDALHGGAGADLLVGGGGDDTYLFNLGDGADVARDTNGLTDQGGLDEVLFGAGITAAGITVTQADGGNDIVIAINGTGDQITLDQTGADGWAQIEQARFADGTVLSHAQLMALATAPTAGNDTFYGSSAGDSLSGGDGDDTLIGRLGNDTLAGGTGNDLLKGGGGDDVYVFNLGDGADVLRDADGLTNQGGSDEVQFGAGITAAGITVSQADNGNDLVIAINGTTDQVTLDQASTDGYARIELVRFADGATLTYTQLLELATGATPGPDNFIGSSGADSLYGGRGDDTLTGKLGNDRLEGGEDNDLLKGGGGNDTYVFDPGFGQDVVSDADGLTNQGGFDIISFGAGIAAADISVSQADTGKDLVITINGTTDQITLNETSASGYATIEEVRFADGTILTHGDLVALATIPTAGDDLFYGSVHNDALGGGDGNDTLIAMAGNDTLTGGAGNDLMKGGSGNDIYILAAGFGQDVISDSNGSLDQGGTDEIQFGAGIASADITVLQADNGNDLVIKINGTTDQVVLDNTYSNGWAQIEQIRFADATVLTHSQLMALAMLARPTGDAYWGDSAANTLAGGDGDDTIYGRAGNDTLSGDSGNDAVYGEDGDDALNGGDGNDLLSGGNGADTLTGGDGDDLFFPDAGADTIYGDGGSDTVDVSALSAAIIVDLALASSQANLGAGGVESWYDVENVIAGSGADTLHGTAAANRLVGRGGVDSLYGRDGNDVLVGGTSDDTLDGGAGDDVFEIGVGDGSDYINGGDGFDTIVATAASVAMLLRPLSSIEAISAGGFANVTILGTSGANTLDFTGITLTGIVKIDGLAGADTLTGSAGADTIVGGTGDDTLNGGSGDDIFQYGTAGDGYDHVAGGDGHDTIVVTGDNAWIGLRSLSSIEAISSGGFSNVIIWGSNVADTLDFSGVTLTGIVKIGGWDGADTLTGSAGNDTIAGGKGDDILNGGAGDDVFQFTNGDGYDFVTGGDGYDMIVATGNNCAIALSSLSGVEEISAGGYTGVTLWGSNVAAGDTLDFSGVTLTGIVKIDGGGGNDVLTGSAGNDTMVGGSGNDWLSGGAGIDTLTGSAGADIFAFGDGMTGLGASADRITDFAVGSDDIDLSAIDADTGTGGDQGFAYIGSAAFTGTAGELRYVKVGSDTWLQMDTDGDGAANMEIVLSGSPTPLVSDFVL